MKHTWMKKTMRVVGVMVGMVAGVMGGCVNAQGKIYKEAYDDVLGLPRMIMTNSLHGDPVIGIEIWSLDEGTEFVWATFAGDDAIASFLDAMQKAKEEYAEWRKAAVKNNVKDFRKGIDVRFPSNGFCIMWNKNEETHVAYGRLEPQFGVTKNGDVYLLSFDGTVADTENKVVTCRYRWCLDSEEMIDEIMGKIRVLWLKMKR